MKKKKIIIGTRSSKLALWQAGFVKAELNRLYPDIEIRIEQDKNYGGHDFGRPSCTSRREGPFC